MKIIQHKKEPHRSLAMFTMSTAPVNLIDMAISMFQNKIIVRNFLLQLKIMFNVLKLKNL